MPAMVVPYPFTRGSHHTTIGGLALNIRDLEEPSGSSVFFLPVLEKRLVNSKDKTETFMSCCGC